MNQSKPKPSPPPCTSCKRPRGNPSKGKTHVDYGVLALDAGLEAGLLDVDDEVTALQVAGHGEGDVEVGDGLGPLVGQSGLLGGLLGAGCGLLLGCGFWGEGGAERSVCEISSESAIGVM